MNQKRDRSWLLLAVVLLLYVTLAVWYSVAVPLGEAPDEVPHYTYVRYLAQHGRLPTTEEEHEAFQPPLYYALGAALTFWIDDQPDFPFAVRANAHYDPTDPDAPKNLLLHPAGETWPYRGWPLAWHLIRLVSIALGAITIWAVFGLGRVLFPGKPVLPLTMAALTAFTPQFLFISSVVNNDNAATAFSALALWQMAALLHKEQCAQLWKRSAVLGLVLGLGLLSKASLAALLPVAGVAILVASYKCEASNLTPQTAPARSWLARAAVSALLAFGLAALVAGWYFIRNWILYGDPMGWSFLLEINALREGPLTPEVFAWLFKGVFRSFWLGWIGIEFDDLIYWLIGAACAVGLAGFGVWLVRGWRAFKSETRWTLILLGMHTCITIASLIQWTATVLGTDQGRLIFPILPTVMLILVAGWAWWMRGRSRPWALGGLAVGMFVLAILAPIHYIGPIHAPAPVASQAELGAATPLNVGWDGIRLLGFRLESPEVKAGGKLILHLYWQALQPIDQDLMALVQLVDQDGEFLMYLDGSPTAGRDTTDRWPPGVPLASRHLLSVPDYGEPGDYTLTISLHPFGERTWLPATAPDGSVVGDHLVLPVTVQLLAP